ncbi:MAG TPA: DUF4340 domain-containing protein [Polyangiaceae bacterium]|jgi:hypothetical protein
MALTLDKKLYVSLGVLVVLGGAVYLQRKRASEDAAAHTFASQELPKLEVSEDQIKKIDKVMIEQPPGDAGKPAKVELKKQGEAWSLVDPFQAKANDSNAKSLVDSLKSLKVTELIDPAKTQYAKYDVSDDKAVHAAFYAGDKLIQDLYFGQSGSRGQMARLAGRDGVYSLKGYSSYLFTRDLKGWRDLSLFKFEDNEVIQVNIENENGEFLFKRNAPASDGKKKPEEKKKKPDQKNKSDEDKDAKWTGEHKEPKARALAKIKEFDPGKVDDLLRAYKALSAVDFTRDKSASDTGLSKPAATITFHFKDGGRKVLQLGATSQGTSRWVKRVDESEIFSISSWAADWATGKEEKFQKGKEDASKKKPDLSSIPGHEGLNLPGGGGEMPPDEE